MRLLVRGKNLTKKRPWALQPDGDLWSTMERIIKHKGAHSMRISWVKGHAQQKHIDQGLSSEQHKTGNDRADVLADRGVDSHIEGLSHLANYYAAKQRCGTKCFTDSLKKNTVSGPKSRHKRTTLHYLLLAWHTTTTRHQPITRRHLGKKHTTCTSNHLTTRLSTTLATLTLWMFTISSNQLLGNQQLKNEMALHGSNFLLDSIAWEALQLLLHKDSTT